MQSCVNIVLNFLSPENTAECIHLSDEIRLLPVHHKARRKLMEASFTTVLLLLLNLLPTNACVLIKTLKQVKKMAVCGIQDAVGEIHDITAKSLS